MTHQTTNLCERYRQVQDGIIKRRDALKGLNISVGLTYTYMNPITGRIDENSPGGIVVQVRKEYEAFIITKVYVYTCITYVGLTVHLLLLPFQIYT